MSVCGGGGGGGGHKIMSADHRATQGTVFHAWRGQDIALHSTPIISLEQQI